MDPKSIRAYPMGFAVAAVAMAHRTGLVDLLNQEIDPKQCKLSPGVRLVALIVAVLVGPMAFYRLPEFYAGMDCEVLFGAGCQAADFNDDAIGRALVKLFDESQRGALFTSASAQAVERLGLPASPSAHLDTTAT